jgi:hypothetical protein
MPTGEVAPGLFTKFPTVRGINLKKIILHHN